MARRGLLAAPLLVAFGSAHAALPEAVTEVLADIAPDALIIATAVLFGIVSVYAFKAIARGL
jgi:hypothetical protein